MFIFYNSTTYFFIISNIFDIFFPVQLLLDKFLINILSLNTKSIIPEISSLLFISISVSNVGFCQAKAYICVELLLLFLVLLQMLI